jgi:hypothetical protein
VYFDLRFRRALAEGGRCWVSQKNKDFAQLSTSGYLSARSGRERGLVSGSSKVGSGEYPWAASVVEYSSTLRDGVANPVSVYLRYRVVNGTRPPAGLARRSSKVIPLGAS